MPVDPGFQGRMQRVEVLIQALEACADATAREGARELVQALLGLHAAGLTRMLELAARMGEPGQALIEQFGRDGLAGSLLLLHGLHPVPLEVRLTQALDRLRPHLHSRGADVRLLGINGGTARLRLGGDPSDRSLRLAVEEAVVEAAPDVTALELEEVWEQSPDGRLPLPLVGP